jgi:hypothetical protein
VTQVPAAAYGRLPAHVAFQPTPADTTVLLLLLLLLVLLVFGLMRPRCCRCIYRQPLNLCCIFPSWGWLGRWLGGPQVCWFGICICRTLLLCAAVLLPVLEVSLVSAPQYNHAGHVISDEEATHVWSNHLRRLPQQ